MSLNSTPNGIQTEKLTRELVDQHGTLLVEFYVPWSGATHIMAPVIKEIQQKYGDQVKICKVNFEDEKELAQEYGVLSAPAFLIIQKGKVVELFNGMVAKKVLQNKLKILIRNLN